MKLTIDEKTAILCALREQEQRMDKWIQDARRSAFHNADMIAKDRVRILENTRSALEKIRKAPIE